MLDPAVAAELNAKNDADLALVLERRAHSLLGKMTIEPGRGMFPLAVETARSFGQSASRSLARRPMWCRRSARRGSISVCATPPPSPSWSSRQGTTDADPGAPELLARYDTMRRADAMSRTIAVDLLNRSLLTDFIAVQGARGLGLYLVDRIGPLRRAVMREGVSPTAAQPRLMRGEAL